MVNQLLIDYFFTKLYNKYMERDKMAEGLLFDKAIELVKEMTLDEKLALLTGKDSWHTKEVERLSIPSMMLTDGPHGLRKQSDGVSGESLNNSYPSTCFPPACLSACSFDVNLLNKMGEAIAKECRKEDVGVILGPGTNIKRSPLGGRNFEYFSEDPYLAGKLSAGFINGCQSVGVGTSLKHFACNNQEYARLINNSIVDERALNEIYLRPFEIAVKESKPWTVMHSYNLINGVYSSENGWLLNDKLRNEFDFDGLVMTDWGAMNDPILSYPNGTDLEMPAFDRSKFLQKAINKGLLKIEDVDKAVARNVEMVLKYLEGKNIEYNYSEEENLDIARTIARESIVLAKNDEILPIKKDAKIALLGPFAKEPRYQGAGSSLINPTKLDNLCEAFDENNISYDYATGYSIDKNATADDQKDLLKLAKSAVKDKDVVIIVAGLPREYESEGFDRKNLDLPDYQNKFIKEIVKINPNVIVILQTGSVVSLPWLDNVKGLFISYLTGCQGGKALYDLIFGDYSPSGRLAETWIKKIEDSSSYNYYAVDARDTLYKESIYVGYRYYDKANIEVAFPFGYGLSYADVAYKNLKILNKKKKYSDNENIEIAVTIKNNSKISCKEVIEVYIAGNDLKAFRPVKELKAFDKVELAPKEEKVVTFTLDRHAFEFYNDVTSKWDIEGGEYSIMIGKDVSNIILSETINIIDIDNRIIPGINDIASVYYDLNNFHNISDKDFETALKKEIVRFEHPKHFDMNSTPTDLLRKPWSRFIEKQMEKEFLKRIDINDDTGMMAYNMFKEVPIRSLGMGGLTHRQIQGFLYLVNGRVIKGGWYFIVK